jgi:hypothetical protein
VWLYVCRRLRLKRYLQVPGDGRVRPQIPAHALLWAQVIGILLREESFHAIEALVHSGVCRALPVSRGFGDDALGYFCERLAPEPTRAALAGIVKQAKRNKAFAGHLIGLALDGTGAGRSRQARCRLCCPVSREEQIRGYQHRLVLISVVGTGLSLPIDVEPYGPGDSERGAGHRVLQRVVRHVGRRFADYVVVDGEYAGAPFLHAAGELGLRVVARLKGNLPDLWAAARERFLGQPPTVCLDLDDEHIEIWDAEDFDPWEALHWQTVRVMRYRQWKRDGSVVEAYWFTDFPTDRLSSEQFYRLAKSRWEIENQGFNDGKNRYGLEHICRHEANSVLIRWLLVCLALTIERLYRLRYLRRGRHQPRTAITLVRLLWLSLGTPVVYDTS